MDLKFLEEIHFSTWATLTMAILATILPGVLLLFMFCRDLFMQLDTIKLILLSASITMPIWTINIILSKVIDAWMQLSQQGSIKEENNYQEMTILGSVFTIMALYTPAFCKLQYDIDIKDASEIVALIEAIFIIILSATCINEGIKRKKRSIKAD